MLFEVTCNSSLNPCAESRKEACCLDDPKWIPHRARKDGEPRKLLHDQISASALRWSTARRATGNDVID